MQKHLIEYLLEAGRCVQKLHDLLDDQVFETLSKHNEYWHSEHDVESDKLDDARRKFMVIQDTLTDILYKLQYPKDYE